MKNKKKNRLNTKPVGFIYKEVRIGQDLDLNRYDNHKNELFLIKYEKYQAVILRSGSYRTVEQQAYKLIGSLEKYKQK